MLCSNVVSRFNSNNTSPPPKKTNKWRECDGTRQSGRSSRQVFLFFLFCVERCRGRGLKSAKVSPPSRPLSLSVGSSSRLWFFFPESSTPFYPFNVCNFFFFSFVFPPAGNATDIENHWLVVFRRFYLNHSLGACCIICAIAIKNTDGISPGISFWSRHLFTGSST